MLTKRIIPCLDVKDGRVVKGVNFVNLRDAGDPVETARYYNTQGADELVFLDITASSDMRRTIVNVVERTAREIFMPLTVGGGIRTVDDFKEILRAGADKVAVNSAAVLDKAVISRAADKFGSQCVVAAIDAKRVTLPGGETSYRVFINGGRIETELDAIEWACEVEALGAGEILLTSMDTDGTKDGFDIPLTAIISEKVKIPVIASGGGGSCSHFYDVFLKTRASAALAATLFHYRELTIAEVKNYLNEKGVPVRI
ncbi:MAG: imidazole glycerol phosphate synthase subunit HisF [Oscillospiraceae bacterium]|nr:imidazole glycerol phosphate synthase subunit HisF [Oscillospiraceae bacterium]